MSDRLLPYDTIIKAHEGDPIAIQAILDRYAGYIRYFSKMNGYYNSDMEDYIRTKTSSPIPDEQRESIMAKSSIAIPNPIFFIVNPPLQMPICFSISYSNYTIKLVNNSTATLDCMRKVRTVFCPDFLTQS